MADDPARLPHPASPSSSSSPARLSNSAPSFGLASSASPPITACPHGLTIYVESIRWMGVRWGMNGVRNGLAAAGYRGDFLYWRWHSTWRAITVLPAIMDAPLLEAQARRLADYLVAHRAANPHSPLHLVGYSAGGYIALRALEILPPDIQVDNAVLMAAAVDPLHDLTAALPHVRHRFVNSSSLLDCIVLGLGTTLFGTGERRHTPSAGMIGLLHRTARDPKIVQLRWRPSMIATLNFGGHFTGAATHYVTQHIAPLMSL